MNIDTNVYRKHETPTFGNTMLQAVPSSEVYLMDCIEGMKHYPDKWFDLAIVDPPYGIGADKKNAHSSIRDNDNYKNADWDKQIPTLEYFTELFRVSKNQIIWGGNYFLDYLPSTQCFIIWNKPERNFSLADAELAWTSFKKKYKVL
jgi:site-specific DNA-methyltransferase (adenine-specific)